MLFAKLLFSLGVIVGGVFWGVALISKLGFVLATSMFTVVAF